MPIAIDPITVNREPLHLLGDRMASGIGVAILIVVGAEDVEDNTDFRKVGLFQALKLLLLAFDILREIVIEEYDGILVL